MRAVLTVASALGLEEEEDALRARAAGARDQLGLAPEAGGELSVAGSAAGALSRAKEPQKG